MFASKSIAALVALSSVVSPVGTGVVWSDPWNAPLALDLDFVNGNPATMLTVSRSGSASFVNTDGSISVAPANALILINTSISV
jgi:hypothetical protein